MTKPRHSKAKAGQLRGAGHRTKESKFEKITGGEMHGRAGESLPSHEQTVVGHEQDWERAEDGKPMIPHERKGASPRRARKQNEIVEIEYERGPGSRFQIEGRGPRSKRQNKGD